MRKIGYARVSTSTQSLDRQIGALRAERCHEVYREKASGKGTKGRPHLEKAIDVLGRGDVLVVAEWDRATRSMMDGIALMTRIHAAGATIVVLDRKALDLTTPMGKGLLSLLSAVFEEERVRIRKRALKGIAEAKRRNKRFGRKPKLTADEATSIRKRIRQGDSYRQIARAFHVHHQTIARIAK